MFNINDVEVLEKERRYEGFFKLERLILKHRLFSGGWSRPIVREVFERGEAVGVLPYDPVHDTVCLIQQFRPGMVNGPDSPWPYEIVAGMMDVEGETQEELARRELREEAGATEVELYPILDYWVSPGGTSERIHLFCGLLNLEGVRGVHGNEYEGEDIKVEIFSREKALSLVESGIVNNAATLISLMWLEKHWERFR